MNEITIIAHWLKALTMGVIMYFALHSLGFSISVCFVAGLMPFLLGGLNVMSGLAYSSSAVALIICVLSIMFPEIFDAIQTILKDNMFELQNFDFQENETDGTSK